MTKAVLSGPHLHTPAVVVWIARMHELGLPFTMHHLVEPSYHARLMPICQGVSIAHTSRSLVPHASMILQLVTEIFNILVDHIMHLMSLDPNFPTVAKIQQIQSAAGPMLTDRELHIADQFFLSPAPLTAFPSNIWMDVLDKAFIKHFCNEKSGALMAHFGDKSEDEYIAAFMEYCADIKAGGKSYDL
jgi:hypothetical protein